MKVSEVKLEFSEKIVRRQLGEIEAQAMIEPSEPNFIIRTTIRSEGHS